MEISENQWSSLISNGKSMESNYFHSVSMENQRTSRICMDFQLKITESNGIAFNFYGKSMEIKDFHWFPMENQIKSSLLRKKLICPITTNTNNC